MIGSPENVPADIRQVDQWVCWRTELRDGKQTKIPIDVQTGSFASTSDRSTWTSFRDAVEYSIQTDGVEGVGFVFTDEGPYTGVDLDDCRDPDSGQLDSWATDVIEKLDSYTEISPSGTGAHVLVKATIPGNHNRKDDLEIYETGRYFTVTGNTGDDLPETSGSIEKRQRALEQVYDEHISQGRPEQIDTNWADEQTPARAENTSTNKTDQASNEIDGGSSADTSRSSQTSSNESSSTLTIQGLSDEKNAALVKRALNAENGEKFRRLWNGNWKGRYESHSEADMAFCSMLAFWCANDKKRMDAIFRQSGLMREKWDSERPNGTYGQITIAKATTINDETFDHSLLEHDIDNNSPQSNGSSAATEASEKQTQSDSSITYESSSPSSHRSSSRAEMEQNSQYESGEQQEAQHGHSVHDRTGQTSTHNHKADQQHSQTRPNEQVNSQRPPGSQVSTATDPEQHTTERGKQKRKQAQSGPASAGDRDRQSTQTTQQSTLSDTQDSEAWRQQLLDFQGTVPPWVEQISQRIQELENEVDRNEQRITHWRKKAKKQEEEIKQLRRRVEQLETECKLQTDNNSHKENNSQKADDESGIFGLF